MTDDKKNSLSLLDKYQSLLIENDKLKAENKKLKEQLDACLPGRQTLTHQDETIKEAVAISVSERYASLAVKETHHENNSSINRNSSPGDKIKLFTSLFKGREDVYAKRWQNKNYVSGYSPVCLNEWKPGICNKPKIKCTECPNKSFIPLNEKVIEEHLKGKVVAGIYPMLPDETCCFLAMDFDDEGWDKDISILRNVCKEFEIPFSVERSRSGSGAHVWSFFEERISASLARKFGSSLLTYSMSKRHEIKFKSYDRLFPNQDTMPKGGFGNLIALPLQMEARKKGNSEFIDENLNPYPDQWEFLSSINKLSEDAIVKLTGKLSTTFHGNELGILKKDDEAEPKPWEKSSPVTLIKNDFPEKVNLVKANMMYVLKDGISQKALNVLKRLAAFKNPAFYKAQAMRLSTYNKPRIISCSDETAEYICLPRGCREDAVSLLNELDVDFEIDDKTNSGRSINIEFNGKLRDRQITAINELLKYDYGVLAAPTAFGKTVIAAKLIAERKINTIILVHRQQLLSQWIKKLSDFLDIKEDMPALEKKRGRHKQQSLIGQVGGGKEYLTGIIDVAIMQSLNRENEVKDFIKNYGMVVVDECHHVPAFSFEQVLKNVHAKYVYGLTATPIRLDGHHPIIFMQCGPVRVKVDSKEQLEQSPFGHYVIPKFTNFRIPIDKESVFGEKQFNVQQLYSELTTDEMRNQLIVNDVIKIFESGRNSLVLTERTAHVELLAKKLHEKIPGIIALTGKSGIKESKEKLKRISETPKEKSLTIIATGRYIGEGFDEPRLDTLFLVMPISWKGTLQQYIGRLHRLYKDKKEVLVFDYVDIHVRMLERMYNKRLNGYASFGYKTKGEIIPSNSANFIFNKESFLPVYTNDITNARKEILIVSPFISKRRVEQMLRHLTAAINNNVKIIIMTRPAEEYNEKIKIVLLRVLEALKNEGINILFKSNIHQKFAIIDERIVWYGSINLLSFGNAEESIMRLESSNIANELTHGMGHPAGQASI